MMSMLEDQDVEYTKSHNNNNNNNNNNVSYLKKKCHSSNLLYNSIAKQITCGESKQRRHWKTVANIVIDIDRNNTRKIT